jgi:hypothetical protein
MADYVTLLGAEQVQSAGHSMSRAGDQMQRAASAIETALFQHQRFMDDWLQRFEYILTESMKAKKDG